MDSYDPEMAQRVWQRVRPEESEPREDLAALAGRVQADGAVYLSLSRSATGRAGAVLKKLAEEKRAQAACLKGMYTLMGGKWPANAASQPQKTLRHCYGSELVTLSQYELNSAHREFGSVFALLAGEQRTHCRLVLELIGLMGR